MLPSPRVVIVYPLHGDAEARLTSRGCEVVRLPDGQDETVADALRNADAVILYSPARVTAEMIRASRRLRVIGAFGAGTDNIDLEAATQAGITVLHNAGVGPSSMVEWTIAAAISSHRTLPKLDALTREGRLDWSTRMQEHLGRDIRGSTYGVLGLGSIGRGVAEIAHVLGANVIAFSRHATAESVPRWLALVSSVDELCDQSDTISVHCSLSDATRGVIAAAQLELLGPGGVLVSCARGGVVDEDDLVAALHAGSIKAAALDVFDPEPPSPRSLAALSGAPNLLLTPHMAGATSLHMEELSESIASRVADALSVP